MSMSSSLRVNCSRDTRYIAIEPETAIYFRLGSMLLINVFRGVSEQHCFKIGVELATLIQEPPHLDSIVAQPLLLADFIDSIGQKPTLPAPSVTSAKCQKWAS
jgi:hypothetical protein